MSRIRTSSFSFVNTQHSSYMSNIKNTDKMRPPPSPYFLSAWDPHDVPGVVENSKGTLGNQSPLTMLTPPY